MHLVQKSYEEKNQKAKRKDRYVGKKGSARQKVSSSQRVSEKPLSLQPLKQPSLRKEKNFLILQGQRYFQHEREVGEGDVDG